MFVMDWVYSVLSWLGLWQKHATILFLGLDNAGKTTLVHRLTTGKMAVLSPTLHKDTHEIKIGNCSIRAVDLGGHEAARRDWENSYYACGGIVYLIDLSDKDRFAESKLVLDGLLATEHLQQTPIVILGNKCDIMGCAREDEVRAYFNMQPTGKKTVPIAKDSGIRPLEFFMCSIKNGFGFGDALTWLTYYVESKPLEG